MTQLGGEIPKAKAAASVLLTLPGVPFVYYGEEIGMTGAKPDELIRTPMHWSSAERVGFTPGQTPNDDSAEVNVADQAGDPGSLLNPYRRLIRLRTEHPALRTGGLVGAQNTCPSVDAVQAHQQ